MTERAKTDEQTVAKSEARPTTKRGYSPPRLQEFGNLLELTRSQALVSPGDALGGSRAF